MNDGVWRVPDAPGCKCKGECGRRHIGGTCAIPDKVDILLKHEADGGMRWGWYCGASKGGRNRATRDGFGPVVKFNVADGVCDLCRGYTGLGGSGLAGSGTKGGQDAEPDRG